MTDTQHTQSAPPRRTLHRSRENNVIAGVCAGLGEHLSINAWWFRWAFIILAFIGGLGILLYALAWVFIPGEDEEESEVTRWLGSLDLTDTGTVLGVVLIGAAAIVVATWVINIPGSLILAAILFAIGILLYRGDLAKKTGSPPSSGGGHPAAETPHDEDASLAQDVGEAPIASAIAPDVGSEIDGGAGDEKPPVNQKKTKPPKPPKPPRESSMLGRMTVAIALIVLSGMALLEASGITFGSNDSADLFDPIHYAATGLAIIGIGLVVGAFVGRARWLMIVGVLMLPVVLLSSLWPRTFDWTADDVYLEPVAAADVRADYSLGAGQFSLDLGALTPDEVAAIGDVEVTLGAGEAIVTIPADVGLVFSGDVGLGQVQIVREVVSTFTNGSESWGEMYEEVIETRNGINARIDRTIGPAPHVLNLDVEVGAGRILIRIAERTTS